MRVLRYLIGAVVVIAIGGYTAFWFSQAASLEQAIPEQIAKGVNGTHFSYDAVHKSGFPLSIRLVYDNPKLVNDISRFSFSLDGKLEGKFSPLGNLKEVEMAGKSRVAIPYDEESPPSEFDFEGNTHAEIEEDEGKLAVSQVKITYSGSENTAPFEMSMDALNAHYRVHEAPGSRVKITFGGQFQGAQNRVLLKEGASTPKEFYDVLASVIAEKSGKTDTSFAFEVDLPSVEEINKLAEAPLRIFTEQMPPMSIELKSFASSHALGTDQFQAALSLEEDTNHTVKVTLSWKGLTHFFAGYREAVIVGIDKMAKAAVAWQPPEDLALVKTLLINHADAVKSLVPQLDAFGNFEAENEITFQINKRTLDWHLLIGNIGLSCDLYGISLRANVRGSHESMEGELTALFKNASGLVEDAVHYYNRGIGAYNLLEQDVHKQLRPLSDAITKKILDFLSGLSGKNVVNPGDIKIMVYYKDEQIHVGQFTADEVLSQARSLWIAILKETLPPQPEPARSTPSRQ